MRPIRRILPRCALAVLILLALAPLLAPTGTAQTGHGQSLPALTVSLAASPDQTRTRSFTLDELAALPQARLSTSTVWTEGVSDFSGVLLGTLLHHLGIDPERFDGTVTVAALDGYSARIPAELISDRAPLLAIRRDGALMPVRNQGPIWVVFPFDEEPRYRTESVYALAVWQVQGLRIEPRVADAPAGPAPGAAP